MPSKRTMYFPDNSNAGSRQRQDGAEPIDPSALAKALKDYETSGSRRDRTPASSPCRKRQRVYGDRQVTLYPFIPNRDGQDLQATYSLLHEDGCPSTPSKAKKRPPHSELHFQKTEEANRTFSRVLRSELFGNTVPQPDLNSAPSDPLLGFSNGLNDKTRSHTPPAHITANLPPASITPTTPHKNLFNYGPSRPGSGHPTPSKTPRSVHGPNLDVRSELYSLSPIRYDSQRILETPRKQARYVNKVPYKVLDAPDLQDDFYLNLVDWGSSNILGVGLANSVYMWNSHTGGVTRLCELKDDTVTSVSWIQRGTHLAIGTGKGLVQIWDAEHCRRLRTMIGHTNRVGALAWNDHILTSGSRDRLIYHRDVRSPDQYIRKLSGHKQEVCGLKWNTEDGQLASGGNDNKLMVWDKLSETPLYRFSGHNAAVKAIAWSPHQHHLLASGGGTADRTIKFWNTQTGSMIKEVDTGSQVCNLSWSKNSDEIISTHGYSQNQIVIWKYPRMEQIVSLTGHTFRVLYLAMSPDGQTVVTGAGDETLRFWKIFDRRATRDSRREGSKLAEWGTIR
ncbi:Cell cycle regulatory protein (Srw1), putative [Penicillium digitatum PHI26]|uniref:Cell cycle regulatory protein (Srw1), putative n=2 Tax=Penicillium digitatum TaxID=36651 RepID=K9G6I5_PEND2|nr:Cell cycle regulatory protein (Srw1), putative [Penicillium digitatum Pd1]EKV16567.1 Cell cycle regulatory protein (Srw1), putative [Penicillium digitatum PHI26]EKV22066.1 Cell cycle regulatory protein (Srw1), putative [Penicillium digitatum Pd1]